MAAVTQLIYLAPNVLILWFYFILRLSLRVLFSEGKLFIRAVVEGNNDTHA